MTDAALLHVPGAGAWRARLRRARRRHRTRSIGDTLTNLYMLLWVAVVYGGALLTSVREHLRTVAGASAMLPEHWWLMVALLLAGTGLVWQAMRAVGPLLATPAERTWGLSTPIDRRDWLLPRFVALTVAGAAAGAATAAGVLLLGWGTGAQGASAVAGGAFGIAACAMAVAAQSAPEHRRWPRLVGAILLAGGAASAVLLVITHALGRVPAPPAGRMSLVLAVIGLPLAVGWTGVALRTIARLDAVALGTGASVAAAAMTTVIWLDPTLLSRVLEVRRWRRVGRVRSRRFLPVPAGRVGVLMQADLRRQARRPGALVIWAALALAQYAVATVAPSLAGVSRIIVAYLAAGRLCGGLRTVAGSNALRRALGGNESTVRLAHLVVPTIGTMLWWVLTVPAGGPPVGAAALVLLGGVVAAAYRGATRPPMTYEGTAFETPLGAFPVEILLQLARGWDLLGAVIILQLLLAR